MDPKSLEMKRGVPKTRLSVQGSGDSFVCPSCGSIPNPETATEHKECGAIFCQNCSDGWMNAKEACPSCHAKPTKLRIVKAELKLVHRLISQLKIACPLAPDSEPCPWQGEYGKLSEHLPTCEHLVLSCSQGCGHKCRRKLMAQHENEECSERKRPCRYCQNYIKVTELEAHVVACLMNPDSVIPCKYACLGCSFKGKPTERLQHEAEHDKEHFDQGLAAIETLTKQLAACQAEESKVKLAPGSLLRQARSNEYTTTTHPHPLKLTKQTGSWHCSGKTLATGCAGKGSGLLPSIVPRYNCAQCNFDLCIKCMEAYIVL
jgi:hypothetical protein